MGQGGKRPAQRQTRLTPEGKNGKKKKKNHNSTRELTSKGEGGGEENEVS